MRKHHRHSIFYRIRRWVRHNRKMAWGSIVIAGIVIAATSFVLYQSYQKQSAMHVTAGNAVDMKNGYRTVEYEGKEYQYNSQIMTILYAEVDSEGKMEPDSAYGDNAKVENISLIMLDKKKKKINILTLDSKTESQMHSYDRDGKDLGLVSGTLSDAYSYGEGGKASCENLMYAVEALLDGITVDEYVVANASSKEQIKELADGILAYVGELAQKFQDDPKMLAEDEKIADEYLQTSITKSKYLSIAQAIDKTSEGLVDYYQLQGQNKNELNEDVYCPDEQQRKKLIIDLFYTPV